MYTVDHYCQMTADRVRLAAYADAMTRAGVAGRVVLDLGSGPGFLAVLACRLGARHVYAVDRDDSILLGPLLCREHGCAQQVTFLHADSREVTLPEPVEVVVSDLRGTIPARGDHVATIIDARDRLLASGGALVPQHDALHAALVSVPAWYRQHVETLTDPDALVHGASLRRFLLNSVYRLRLGGEELVSDAVCWAHWHYPQLHNAELAGRATFTVKRSALAHGIVLWFETRLFEDIGYSAGPGSAVPLYGQLLLPFEEPVSLTEGDVVQTDIDVRSGQGEDLFSWRTTLPASAGRPGFQQSTFFSDPRALSVIGDEAGTPDAAPGGRPGRR